MSVTEKVDGKRVWGFVADTFICGYYHENEKEKAISTFKEGLVESGFRECGSFAGVERWALYDTDLIIVLDTNKCCFSVFPEKEVYFHQNHLFFEQVRERWKELINNPKDV